MLVERQKNRRSFEATTENRLILSFPTWPLQHPVGSGKLPGLFVCWSTAYWALHWSWQVQYFLNIAYDVKANLALDVYDDHCSRALFFKFSCHINSLASVAMFRLIIQYCTSANILKCQTDKQAPKTQVSKPLPPLFLSLLSLYLQFSSCPYVSHVQVVMHNHIYEEQQHTCTVVEQ